MTTLLLDIEGDLWLRSEDGSCRLLGPIDTRTARSRVPAELAEQLERLDEEWAEAVEFSAAMRAEVNACYLRAKGAF